MSGADPIGPFIPEMVPQRPHMSRIPEECEKGVAGRRYNECKEWMQMVEARADKVSRDNVGGEKRPAKT